MMQPIKLRPHHLLCMLTFAGEGYSPAFVANFQSIAQRLASGAEAVELVDTPDDICAPLLCGSDCHCHNASVIERDKLARTALEALLGLPLYAGERLLLTRETFATLRHAFAAGTIREACVTCPWSSLCSAIAQNKFIDTALLQAPNH